MYMWSNLKGNLNFILSPLVSGFEKHIVSEEEKLYLKEKGVISNEHQGMKRKSWDICLYKVHAKISKVG